MQNPDRRAAGAQPDWGGKSTLQPVPSASRPPRVTNPSYRGSLPTQAGPAPLPAAFKPPHAGGSARLAPPVQHPAPALHPCLVQGMHVGEPLPERGNLGRKLKVLPVLPEKEETLLRHKTCARNIHWIFFFSAILYCPTLGAKPRQADEPQFWPKSFHLSGFEKRN